MSRWWSAEHAHRHRSSGRSRPRPGRRGRRTRAAASRDPRAAARCGVGPGRLAARQSLQHLVVERDHPADRLSHHPLGARLHRLGRDPRGLERAAGRQRAAEHAGLPGRDGSGACWAMVGEKYRFILFGRYPYDQQWRPAICIALFIGLYAVSAHAPLLAPRAPRDLDRDARRHRLADVGRRARPALRVAEPVGRPAAHADPRDLRPRLRLPARRARRPRPPLAQPAGGAHALRRLCRADPRRAADQRCCSWRA